MKAASPASPHGLALFLDVDGTLLEIAPTPDAVYVPTSLLTLLARLSQAIEGALALISGRQLVEIDRLFAPLRFNAAGAHGCELRVPGGTTTAMPIDPRLVATIHERCRILPEIAPGVLVEYKAFGVAIHYRLVPDAEPLVAAHALQLLEEIGPEFTLQPGKYVCELKPKRASKGSAINALMAYPPFAGRRAMFIGDDATDEHGFKTVDELEGISIKVGCEGPSIARRRLASPAQVQRLLAQLCELSATARTGAPDWLDSLLPNTIATS